MVGHRPTSARAWLADYRALSGLVDRGVGVTFLAQAVGLGFVGSPRWGSF